MLKGKLHAKQNITLNQYVRLALKEKYWWNSRNSSCVRWIRNSYFGPSVQGLKVLSLARAKLFVCVLNHSVQNRYCSSHSTRTMVR